MDIKKGAVIKKVQKHECNVSLSACNKNKCYDLQLTQTVTQIIQCGLLQQKPQYVPLAGSIMHLHRKLSVSKIDIFQLFPWKLLHITKALVHYLYNHKIL